jgi:restriction system protein
VARRRGFFAELQHQSQVAEQNRRRQAANAYRAQAAAQRDAERAHAAAARAMAAAAASDARDRVRLEREAAQLHVQAQLAAVEHLNAELAHTYEQIDGILAATLAVDDFVDLETLKINQVQHPPFEPGVLGVATPSMPELIYLPEPSLQTPPPAGMFGKQKHAAEVARLQAEHEQARRLWHAHNTDLYNQYVAEAERRAGVEQDRVGRLAVAQAQYQEECRQRELEAETHNQQVTKFINDLAFDVESAIHDYVGIVLSNSAYPEAFPVEHDFDFDLVTRELRLVVSVQPPAQIPSTKEYRYIKASDEISSVALSMKQQKDRYAGAVHQTALRTLHEIFEADRSGKIHSISLTVVTNTFSPATGRTEAVPFVVVAADRATFSDFDLANVVPHATLEHLAAAISKSPFDLIPADTSRGVRTRKA